MGVVRGRKRVVQAEREREMAEVVGRKGQLHALRGQLQLGQEGARVVDEDVEWAGPVPHKRGDRALVGEVEPGNMDGAVASRRCDVASGACPGFDVPDGEGEVGCVCFAGEVPGVTA